MTPKNIAVFGATGAVGVEMVKVLEERVDGGTLAVRSLRLLASRPGRTVKWRGDDIPVEEVTLESWRGIDVALFAVDSDVSRKWAPVAVEAGSVVIDNSSAFRMAQDVSLVVPEVNPEDIASHAGHGHGKIIANPNCSTIIAMVALAPLHRAAGLVRLCASTYQAVSGAGKAGQEELERQIRDYAATKWDNTNSDPDMFDLPSVPSVFQHQIAFNLIPHIDAFVPDDWYTKEELKMRDESRKILHAPSLRVSATCVRVPVMRSHSEALTIETERPLSPGEARAILERAPGVKVIDEPLKNRYPMPLFASDQDLVHVGRIRRDHSAPEGCHGLVLWVSGDQLRKGAATNAVQIAELL
ncbi:MAG: aspartate-semialdehyde dehydrogenase [Synergistaceae bacterium]|jgi:aspartate-semialdehyde dehydrogenase|nr:aspartate-semialdehyde dehydrogenase [Synergistaceae bacterium]